MYMYIFIYAHYFVVFHSGMIEVPWTFMVFFQAPKAVVLIVHGGAGWLGP